MGLRVPEKIVAIAIYGSSCTGKSVIAKELSDRLNAPLRQCGKIIGTELQKIGMTVSDPEAIPIHEQVDEETRSAAKNTRRLMIIEGRFLDIVLRGVPGILFVELICNHEVRSDRMQTRDSVGDFIAVRDVNDANLVQSVYTGSHRGGTEDLRIDTTSMAVEDIVTAIVSEYRDRAEI
jgi:cytidylate kinase